MGEIYGVVQGVLQIITPLVTSEASLFFGLKDNVVAIKDDLLLISKILKQAEELVDEDDIAKDWVTRVRILAYGIEDVIDRYQLYQEKNIARKAMEIRNIASTIKSLRATAKNIAGTNSFHDGVSVRGECSQRVRLPMSLPQCTMNKDYEVVQDDVAKREIIELIGLKNRNMTPSTTAVVGMRGLGKTAVVGSVYYDKVVRSHFPRRAWISLNDGDQYNDILRSMTLQFSNGTNGRNLDDLKSMDARSLQQQLLKYLQGKRYMVVFDNVGENDIELKGYIKSVLHFNNEASKIIVTTRYENIAHAWLDGSTTGMYKLKSLPFEKALELFCKKAFQSSGGKCPAEPDPLNVLACGIVKKCGGLPLVVISVGEFLSTKNNDHTEWHKVRQSLQYYLSRNRQLSRVHKTFMESYYDLPYYLKPCFLYFGMFPKRYHVSRMRLIRLWIAEGFIRKSSENLTLEEVAEDYMSELINISMIEVKSRDPSGKVRTLGVVSKVLYKIILSKLDELSFCKILFNKDIGGSEASRRLSIHDNHLDNAPEFLDNITQSESSIRSLLVTSVGNAMITKVLDKSFLKKISLLKVLDLFDAPISSIPEEVGKLLNLQYLSLRHTQVSELPGSIGKLDNLQTLDLKHTFITEFPAQLIQLRKLRHLLGYNYQYDISFGNHCLKVNGIKTPKGLLGKCLELQKLAYLDLDLNVEHNWVTELRNLKQLRKLGIVGLQSHEGEALCYVIDGMKYLQAFSVISKNKSAAIDLTHVKSPPEMLKRLYLTGPLSALPSWFDKLHGLIKLRLKWSNLDASPLQILQSLPNLVELQLLEAFIGADLAITSGGFRKLKILQLLDLHSLKSLLIAKGALPHLNEMTIGKSEYLQVPSGIKYLSTLTKLNFYNMPSNFTDQIQRGERHYSIVKHVPSIQFFNNGYEVIYG